MRLKKFLVVNPVYFCIHFAIINKLPFMIKVNPNQKGNNILTHINKTAWHFNDQTTDYEINNDISILFLSIRFHVSKPEYIHRRIKKLEKYKHCVLMIRIDTVNYESILLELFEISNLYGCVMILCFSDIECGFYLSSFDVKNRGFMKIRRKCETVEEFLKIVPKVNKIDVKKIMKSVENLKDLMGREDKWLKSAVGLSEMKIDLMRKYFRMSF